MLGQTDTARASSHAPRSYGECWTPQLDGLRHQQVRQRLVVASSRRSALHGWMCLKESCALYKLCITTFSCLRGYAPQYLMDFCRPASDVAPVHDGNVFIPPADDSLMYHASGPVHLHILWLHVRWHEICCQTTGPSGVRRQGHVQTTSEDVSVCFILMHRAH